MPSFHVSLTYSFLGRGMINALSLRQSVKSGSASIGKMYRITEEEQ